MARSFSVRGVVEGFYGRPWSWSDRRSAITFLAARGLNAYVYAPKDDALHRERWRDPYPDGEIAELRSFARLCADLGVRMGFSISPGLDIDYRSDSDLGVLAAKLTLLAEVGVDWFLLLLDDIPMRPDLAVEQGSLATRLRAALDPGGTTEFTVCPTEYMGTRPTSYLGALAHALPPDASVMWTGPTVCSPRIAADDARSWIGAVGGRRVLLWDNTPVNDATMTHALHFGPYTGRTPDLADVLAGVLCNPMTQAHASLVQLGTAMAFLSDPDGYDPERAWAESIAAVGGDRAGALGALARTCADGPLTPPSALVANRMVGDLEHVLSTSDWPEPACTLASELRTVRSLPDDLDAASADDRLAAEVEPWVAAAALEARAGLAAIRLVQALRPPAGAERADSGVAPERALALVFGLIARWTAARGSLVTTFGPRFAVYSAVRQRPDGSPVLDVAEAVREDANAIDRLCRLALADYEIWVTTGASPARFSTRSGAVLPFTDVGRRA